MSGLLSIAVGDNPILGTAPIYRAGVYWRAGLGAFRSEQLSLAVIVGLLLRESVFGG